MVQDKHDSIRSKTEKSEVWHSAVKNASLDQSPCSDTVELGGVGRASVSESALTWAERAELNKDMESQRGLIHLSAQHRGRFSPPPLRSL